MLAAREAYAGAAIFLAGAVVFDLVDGAVAKRTPGRTGEQRAFGANLDSLADMVSAGTAVGVVILSYGDFRAAYLPVAALLAGAAALRLSYFNVHGLDASSVRSPACRPAMPPPPSWRSCSSTGLSIQPPSGSHSVQGGGVGRAHGQSVPFPKLTGRSFVAFLVLELALVAAHAARLIG